MVTSTVTQLASNSSSVATTTVSFTAQTAGVMLLLWVAADDYRTTTGSGRPESTGWTLRESQQGNLGWYLWYKVSTGSETSVQYTIGSASKSRYHLTAATNVDGTTPWNNSTSDLSAIGGSNTTRATPSSTPSGSGDVVAFGGLGQINNSTTVLTFSGWTNSFTEIHDGGVASGSYADSAGVAYLNTTAAGTGITTTATTSGVWSQVSGITAILNLSSGGGSNLGTLSASVPVVTASISGASVNVGTMSVQVPRVATSITGASVNTGSMNATVPVVTGSISGASKNDGTLTTQTPSVTASVSGASVNAGTLSANIPVVTAAVTGSAVNAGTLSSKVPLVTMSVADQAVNLGSMSATVPVVTAAISGASVNPGTLSASVPAVTMTVTGTAKNNGTLSAAVPVVTMTVSDTTTNQGTLTAKVPVVTAALTGSSINAGTLAASVPVVTATLTGTARNTGTLSAALPVVTATLTGTQRLTGTLSAVIPLVLFHMDNGIRRDITVTGTLGPRRWTGSTNPVSRTGTIHRRWEGTNP